MFKAVSRQMQVLSSTLDLWRGTMLLQATQQPRKSISLYGLEGDRDCRQVRETLTALGLDVVVYLEDPNTGVALFESADIIDYLEQRYAIEPLAG